MKGNILPYVLTDLEVQDIDNETDWEIAEMKYRLMREKEALDAGEHNAP